MRDILEKFGEFLCKEMIDDYGNYMEVDSRLKPAITTFINDRHRTHDEIKNLLDSLNIGVCDSLELAHSSQNERYTITLWNDNKVFSRYLTDVQAFATIEELRLSLLEFMYGAKAYFASIEESNSEIEQQSFFPDEHKNFDILIKTLLEETE